MLNKEQQAIYDAYIKKNPGRYIIPEPPRGNTIRLYNKYAVPPFVLIGDKLPHDWRCLARKLDVTLNYWEKTPISNEELWVNGLHMYLIPEDEVKYYEGMEGLVRVGVSLFAEDEYNNISMEQLASARERFHESYEERRRAYEDQLVLGLAGVIEMPVKPKRKGRPKGSKNRIKEISNG
jgi:hypothetical protein